MTTTTTKKTKTINIYTDGGYRPLKNIGAYGFYVSIGQGKQIKKSGYIKAKKLSSNVVEFISFLKAIQHLKKARLLDRKDVKMVFYTDSLNLKNVFYGIYFFYSIFKLSKNVQKIRSVYGHKIEVIWVSRNKIPEQRFCDQLCDKLLDNYKAINY